MDNLLHYCREGAHAIPGYQKLYARNIHYMNSRGGTLNRKCND